MYKFRKELDNVLQYIPGRPSEDVMKEYNLEEVVKLASNENPLGPSPKCRDAILNCLDSLSIYPDGNCTHLKEAISSVNNIPTENIAISSGSDEMIEILSTVFVNPSDEIIISEFTFSRYKDTTNIMGGIPVIVPLKNWHYDLNAILKAITPNTRAIWLCNPNNPTGTMFTENELVAFLKVVPSHIFIIYDEAYREYVESSDYPKDNLKLLSNYSNLIIMRTFSKAYGLAALRVGYTFANVRIIDYINKARGPFNVNSLAQAAAIAAIKDEPYLKKVYDLNIEGKYFLYDEFDKLDIEYIKSETNHIFFSIGKDANSIFNELQKKGVIIRAIKDEWLRVSIGTKYENEKFIETLKTLL